MAEDNKVKEKQGMGNKIVVIVGAVIIVVLATTVVLLLAREKTADTTATKEVKQERDVNVVVNQDNAEAIGESMIQEEYIAPGYYSTQMSMEWHFATGDAVSDDAYVANDKLNTNDVYFDVVLADDENTVLLQSPVIPRGSELKDISLDKSIDAGAYDCVMIYHLIDDAQNTISTLRIGFTIIVEN